MRMIIVSFVRTGRSTKAGLGLVMIVMIVLQIVLVDIDTDGLKMN